MNTTPFDLWTHPPHVSLANFYPFAPGEVIGPHWSESDLYLPVTHGKGIVEIGSQSFELTQGQVLHVPWSTPLRYRADGRDPFVLIGLHLCYLPWRQTPSYPLHGAKKSTLSDFSQTNPPTPQPFNEPFVITPTSTSSRLIELASRIATTFTQTPQSRSPRTKLPTPRLPQQEQNQKALKSPHKNESDETPTPETSDREPLLRALALEFIIDVRRERHRLALHHSHPQARMVHEMTSWMELSFRRSISRSELAKRAGVSESSLASAFRAVTGRSPIDYLIDLRLTHACALLNTSRQRISEVAENVGIPDVYYFSKLFKRRIGTSPLNFRKRNSLI